MSRRRPRDWTYSAGLDFPIALGLRGQADIYGGDGLSRHIESASALNLGLSYPLPRGLTLQATYGEGLKNYPFKKSLSIGVSFGFQTWSSER